jgi:hypothetical protein
MMAGRVGMVISLGVLTMIGTPGPVISLGVLTMIGTPGPVLLLGVEIGLVMGAPGPELLHGMVPGIRIGNHGGTVATAGLVIGRVISHVPLCQLRQTITPGQMQSCMPLGGQTPATSLIQKITPR